MINRREIEFTENSQAGEQYDIFKTSKAPYKATKIYFCHLNINSLINKFNVLKPILLVKLFDILVIPEK